MESAHFHKTTEGVNCVEGITVGHLIQPLCLGKVVLEHMAQECIQMVLVYLQ